MKSSLDDLFGHKLASEFAETMKSPLDDLFGHKLAGEFAEALDDLFGHKLASGFAEAMKSPLDDLFGHKLASEFAEAMKPPLDDLFGHKLAGEFAEPMRSPLDDLFGHKFASEFAKAMKSPLDDLSGHKLAGEFAEAMKSPFDDLFGHKLACELAEAMKSPFGPQVPVGTSLVQLHITYGVLHRAGMLLDETPDITAQVALESVLDEILTEVKESSSYSSVIGVVGILFAVLQVILALNQPEWVAAFKLQLSRIQETSTQDSHTIVQIREAVERIEQADQDREAKRRLDARAKETACLLNQVTWEHIRIASTQTPIRRKPQKGSQRVGTLFVDQPVYLDGQSKRWGHVQVQVNGRTIQGWVRKSSLRKP